ncbi:MAG: DNA-binding protein [Rhodanobacteraceae bacterium]|nr:DNA-binding protein [Rhodanobacteraceae bacterium]
MSRSSDTRQRTREAAAKLVVGGKHPHEITVDAIYAVIQQGSRTTINDALKAWREERTKVDALGADLPPALADTMRSLWVSAVEQGERVFLEQRQALEDQVATETARADTAARQRDEIQGALDRAVAVGDAEKTAHVQTRDELARTRAAVAAAETHAVHLEQQLTCVRDEAARDRAALQAALERQAAEFQETLANRDRGYQAELDKATTRLQSVQDHMLQNIDAAREAQKRAEAQQAKLQQRVDTLQADITDLRVKHAEQGRELHLQRDREATLSEALQRSRDDSQRLAIDLAGANGQLSAAASQVAAAEDRARVAEARLDRTLAEVQAQTPNTVPADQARPSKRR